MQNTLEKVFALLRPSIDAHTLGVSTFSQLLEDVGVKVVIAPKSVNDALNDLNNDTNSAIFQSFLITNKVTSIGVSYRLDPEDALTNFANIYSKLLEEKFLRADGGLVEDFLFAGLPQACQMITEHFPDIVKTFLGDESSVEILSLLNIPKSSWPKDLEFSSKYDLERDEFARKLIEAGTFDKFSPLGAQIYPEMGSQKDGLLKRLWARKRISNLPLTRVHAGPYSANRLDAIKKFCNWARTLASNGYLDILSLGTSQLSQSNFGEEWGDRPNGGGVPVNSEEEFHMIGESARPMLVRTYSGTKNIPTLAKVYEKTINNAWCALSLWWFCKVDGRGENNLLNNLKEHIKTIQYIASVNKPFEANVSHHFAFRGGTDNAYVLSVVLAALTAKANGIRTFVFQNMLNTPKATWGVQDLAKARAALKLLRNLEDDNFTIIYQPRAGLDYFSHDLDKAKIQLASVSCLMDDVEPERESSPDIVHVVSYSEGAFLATPQIIDESIKITLSSISEYRDFKKNGESLFDQSDVENRTNALIEDVSLLLDSIYRTIPNPNTAEWLYKIFQYGYLPVPALFGERDKFPFATQWTTRINNGGCVLFSHDNKKVSAAEHAAICEGFSIIGERY
tara:strand:- start:3591 stop:5456 length:1866 start_codon:yes stop_codon:yes gene_type:complete